MEQKTRSLKEIPTSEIEQAFSKTISEIQLPRGRLQLVSPDRYEAVFEFIKDCYMKDEPLKKSVGIIWTQDGECLWRKWLGENLSFILVNEQNGDLMAMRLMHVATKEEHFDYKISTDEPLKKIIAFLDNAFEQCNIYEMYQVDEVIDFDALAVAKKYRQQGLGTFLINVAVKFIKNLGVSPCLIRATATSNYSIKIFEKCGFELLGEFPYATYIVDGEVVFKNTGENKSMKMYKLSV